MHSAIWTALNTVQAIATAVWSAGWIVAALAVRVLCRDARPALAMARRCWAPGMLWIGGLRLEVAGLERVDWSRPHFFAANHESFVDVVAAYRALPVPLVFILKEELGKVPFLGWYVRAMGMILVPREERRRSLESLAVCRHRLEEGMSILFFPAGTRSRDGSVGRFKSSAFLPAIDTATPVVPVAIDGAGKILPAGGFRVRPGTIRLVLGDPVPTAGLGREDRRQLAEQVQARVVELRAGSNGE